MPVLEKIEFQLTTECNVRCLYCINGDGRKSKLMPEDIILEIMEYFRPNKVSFTGGEPLLCLETLLKCLKEAKRNGSQTQVNTNFELADKTIISSLADSGLEILHVTFDTLRPEVYAKLRKSKPENLAKVIGNITLAVLEKISVIPEVTPTAYNVKEIGGIFDFVTLLGVKGLEVQRLILGGRANSDLLPLKEVLVEQIIEVAQKLDKTKPYLELWCFPASDYPELFALGKNGVRYAPCDCGRKALWLGCDGSVYACNFFYEKKVANIFEPKTKSPVQNLKEIWENHPVFQKIRQGCFGEKLCTFQQGGK